MVAASGEGEANDNQLYLPRAVPNIAPRNIRLSDPYAQLWTLAPPSVSLALNLEVPLQFWVWRWRYAMVRVARSE